jgi:hypothetical protein
LNNHSDDRGPRNAALSIFLNSIRHEMVLNLETAKVFDLMAGKPARDLPRGAICPLIAEYSPPR